MGHSLAFIYATELVKLTDEMDVVCINVKFSVHEPSEWNFYSIPMLHHRV